MKLCPETQISLEIYIEIKIFIEGCVCTSANDSFRKSLRVCLPELLRKTSN